MTDPEKRAKYDLGGEEALDPNANAGGQGGFHRGGDPFNTFFQFFNNQGGGGGFHNQHFQQQPVVQNMYDEKSGVVEIANVNDWNTQVGQRSDIFVVDFYSPGCAPCIKLKDEYISLAKTFNGIVKLLAVNCAAPQAKQICSTQRVQNYPTVRMYLDGNKEIDFSSSQEKNSKILGNWVSNSIPDYTTNIDSSSHFKSYIDTAQSKAMVFLFSDKKQTPAMFKSLCRLFRTNIACGVVLDFNPQSPPSFIPENLASQISKTPTLFYVHDGFSLEGELFKGSMTSEILSLFFSRVTSHRSRQVTVDQLTPGRSTDCSKTDSSTCILLFDHPMLPTGNATESYSVLRKLAETYKEDPVKFFWIDPEAKFGNIFDQKTDSKLVAYRGKRGKYSAYDGCVEYDSVNSWIDNIVSGGSGLPLAVTGTPKHDEL